MHAQWPYRDRLHAYSDLYTLYTATPCVLNPWRSSCSESVTAERILHRWVRQHHVGITEHAQAVQAEGLDAQLVLQWEASLRVKTFGHRTQCAADVLWQTGVGVIWERERNRWWWVNVFSCSENTSSRYNSQCRCTHRCPDSSFLDKSDADRKRHNISCCSRKPKLEPEAAKFMDACSSPFWEKCQTATIDSWETRRSADAHLWFQPQERITNLTTHSC